MSWAKTVSNTGWRYIRTVEETMDHTGAGKASYAGSGDNVANFAA